MAIVRPSCRHASSAATALAGSLHQHAFGHFELDAGAGDSGLSSIAATHRRTKRATDRRPEMLTDMKSGSTAPTLRSAAAIDRGEARPTFSRHQSVISTISPLASATGMKVARRDQPARRMTPSQQRLQAGQACVARRTTGWKTSSSSPFRSARRSSLSSDSVPIAASNFVAASRGIARETRGRSPVDHRDRFAISCDHDAKAHAQDRIGLARRDRRSVRRSSTTSSQSAATRAEAERGRGKRGSPFLRRSPPRLLARTTSRSSRSRNISIRPP